LQEQAGYTVKPEWGRQRSHSLLGLYVPKNSLSKDVSVMLQEIMH